MGTTSTTVPNTAVANTTVPNTAVANTTVTNTTVANTTTLNDDPKSQSPPVKKLKAAGRASCCSNIDDDYYKDHFDSDRESDPPPDYEWEESTYCDDGSTTEDDDEGDGANWTRKMTHEEFARYTKQVNESKGYDVDSFPDVFMIGLIAPVNVDHYRDIYTSMTKFAIERYNNKKNKNLQFVKIVKLNMEPAGPCNYYITFDAKDDDGHIKTYQAMVSEAIPAENTTVRHFRLKPGQ